MLSATSIVGVLVTGSVSTLQLLGSAWIEVPFAMLSIPRRRIVSLDFGRTPTQRNSNRKKSRSASQIMCRSSAMNTGQALDNELGRVGSGVKFLGHINSLVIRGMVLLEFFVSFLWLGPRFYDSWRHGVAVWLRYFELVAVSLQSTIVPVGCCCN